MNCIQDILAVREDFPILQTTVHGHSLVYLDNAATTQVPQQVIDAIAEHYACDNANVHRGIHTLSERSTTKLEEARRTVERFINAGSNDKVIFTSGTTAGINMAARGLEHLVEFGSIVAVTAMEHHSNFVPWQQLCKRKGAELRVIGLTKRGEINKRQLNACLETGKCVLVACAHVSNVLGTVNDVADITRRAHEHGAMVLVDAAQSIRHELVDVQEIGCDFLAFSGHKTLGPTGIGALYVSERVLDKLQPNVFGGGMVDKVTSASTTFEPAPGGFEAGTPNYVGAIAMAKALDYISGLGRVEIHKREHELLQYADDCLCTVKDVEILGNPSSRGGCVSFSVKGQHPFDIAFFMDKLGIALRSGNQCAQPLLHEVYGIKNITRVSPAFYNTKSEIDAMIEGLEKTLLVLRANA